MPSLKGSCQTGFTPPPARQYRKAVKQTRGTERLYEEKHPSLANHPDIANQLQLQDWRNQAARQLAQGTEGVEVLPSVLLLTFVHAG